jgi:hypothetical protein
MNFNKNNFRIDKDVAYFLGVLHSDGCIYFFNNKKENRKQIRLNLTIGKKSIPMALKFQRILSTHFNRTVNLRKVPNKEAYVIQTSINRLWYLFKNWKDQNIPREIKDSYRLFGVYLAGLIDGDGFVQIKNNTQDRIIPQCVIKIGSDRPLKVVRTLIKNYFGCKPHFEYAKKSNTVETCFYISKKNFDLVETFVLPHIVMPYKAERINKFLKMKKTGL